MFRKSIRVVCAVAVALATLLAGAAGGASAQTAGGPPINVFLDCQANNCDSAHFRTEIGFVNWVRDRADADVHLLITSQGTGSGGTSYALSFFGMRGATRDTLQLSLATPQTSTSAEQRDLLTNRIAQGLLRYAVGTAAAERVLVRMPAAGDEDDEDGAGTLPAGARDPWKQWVFEIGMDAGTDGEQQQSSKEFQAEINARRVTDIWKFEFSLDGSYDENRFELEEGTLRSIRRNWSSDAQLTKALLERWSAGLQVEVGTSTFRNQDLRTRFAPVLEYSFYPYSEFSRRRITLLYSAGVNRLDYTELTIFDKLNETVFDEGLQLVMRYQQPWGSASAQVGASHYLHDLSRYEAGASAGVNVRLLKGLSANMHASYSRVHNQLYIRKGDASDEDVLLERLALATGYQYNMSAGLSYTFGSIFNNIVNRRID